MCQESGTKTKYIFLIITEADADENGLGPPYFLPISSGLSVPS